MNKPSVRAEIITRERLKELLIYNKEKHLGLFRTKEEAHQVYLNAKRELHTTCTI